MTATPLLFGLAAAIATLVGGLIALRLRRRLAPLLAVTAGVVLGVALFHLVPEAIELGRGRWSVRGLAAFIALGLGGYMLLDRALGRATWLPGAWRPHLGPATLTLHSLMDGMGIGLAFQVGDAAGWLVALAVLTHDLADGINTVGLCLAARSEGAARRWLLVNGVAPVAGVLLGLAASPPDAMLAPLVATFAGLFLYIGACELAPRSFALDPRLRTTLASLGGMALMLLASLLAH